MSSSLGEMMMLGMLRMTPVSSKGIACPSDGISVREEKDLKLPMTAVDRACKISVLLPVLLYIELLAYSSQSHHCSNIANNHKKIGSSEQSSKPEASSWH